MNGLMEVAQLQLRITFIAVQKKKQLFIPKLVAWLAKDMSEERASSRKRSLLELQIVFYSLTKLFT